MVNAGNAGTGSRDRAVVLGPRSGLLDRRSFLFGSAFSVGALSLAGCVTQDGMSVAEASKLYGPRPDEKFPIAAVDISKVDPKYYRRTVRYGTKEVPGTIIVDPGNYYVYRIEGDGSATRYGANVQYGQIAPPCHSDQFRLPESCVPASSARRNRRSDMPGANPLRTQSACPSLPVDVGRVPRNATRRRQMGPWLKPDGYRMNARIEARNARLSDPNGA